MTIDLNYMANILSVFRASDTAYTPLDDFQASELVNFNNGDNLEKFIFHMELLIDNQLISNKAGLVCNLKGIGVERSTNGCSIKYLYIRLTQSGHDFSSALNNKEVMDKLKTEFKDVPFKVIFEGGQKLLQHYMKKKLDNILE